MTVKEYNISVEKYADSVYRFIRANLKDDDRSNDVVQDSYEKLWRFQLEYAKIRCNSPHWLSKLSAIWYLLYDSIIQRWERTWEI